MTFKLTTTLSKCLQEIQLRPLLNGMVDQPLYKLANKMYSFVKIPFWVRTFYLKVRQSKKTKITQSISQVRETTVFKNLYKKVSLCPSSFLAQRWDSFEVIFNPCDPMGKCSRTFWSFPKEISKGNTFSSRWWKTFAHQFRWSIIWVECAWIDNGDLSWPDWPFRRPGLCDIRPASYRWRSRWGVLQVWGFDGGQDVAWSALDAAFCHSSGFHQVRNWRLTQCVNIPKKIF